MTIRKMVHQNIKYGRINIANIKSDTSGENLGESDFLCYFKTILSGGNKVFWQDVCWYDILNTIKN